MVVSVIFLGLLLQSPVRSHAEEATALSTISVEGRERGVKKGGEVVREGIQAAKKTTTIVPEIALPQNSYRQVLSSVPGLMVSEVNNESWASLSYRGLGDPHESFNVHTLRNGIPMSPDMYGYPAAYYNPPMAAVEAVEFYGSGASLLFGPQPGGALNYVLRKAPLKRDPWRMKTALSGGSNELVSSYQELTKGWEKGGVLGAYHFRRANGFREANSEFRIHNPRAEVRYRLDDRQSFSFDFDHYDGHHGEPGGLARVTQGGFLGVDGDWSKTTLRHDQIEIRRSVGTIGYDGKWSDDTAFSGRFWHGLYNRDSYRQAVGNSNAFGFAATGSSNTIQKHSFYQWGSDLRLNHTYSIGHSPQTLTIGMGGLLVASPFTQATGSSPTAREGTKTRDIERETKAVSLAIENKFSWRGFSLVPGARVEHIDQSIDEALNLGSSVALRKASKDNTVFLGGLGLSQRLNPEIEVYANYSQGFKPVSFQDTVPLSSGDTISGDLQEGRSTSTDLGWRGKWRDLTFDGSLFLVRYKNQFGRVGTNIQNVGDAEHLGTDLYLSYEFGGGWELYSSALWMDAEFTKGPNLGKQPQYAPKLMTRPGMRYRWGSGSLVSLQGQVVKRHFGNDNNSADFEIPSYSLWDLSGELALKDMIRDWDHDLRFTFGVQNLLDRKYWARVRSNGIEPGSPRTFFVGLSGSL